MPASSQSNDDPYKWPANADYSRQSITLPGTALPGETRLDEGLRRSAGGPFLGHRPILSRAPLTLANYHVWQSWPDVDARRRAVGSAVHKLFQSGELVAGDLETVGIWSKNCPNWLLVDLAMQAYQKVSVPLYDTLGADAVEHVVNHAGLSIIFAASEHVPHLLKLSPNTKTTLTEWASTRGIKFTTMEEFEAFGRKNLTDVIYPSPSTIATICYTSGTSGTPKGVLLSHGNLAISVTAYLHYIQDEGPERTALSFLPLAHIYERMMEFCTTAIGRRIGYTSNDPLRLLEDIQLLRPHFVALVPRVLNRLYQAMAVAADAPGLRGVLFRRALETKVRNMRATGSMTHPVWDRLVFQKINNVLGGRMTKIASGSAPLGQRVCDFLKVCTLADIVDGYGMTENGGCCLGGTVGSIVPTVEVKFIDVPALGYHVTDKPFPRGEILMRGDGRFVGYYKEEAKTRETIDDDGWLHTGDVGTTDGQGRLRIIDRYVALENVENVYAMCPLVAQAFVYGDSLRHFLVGVVVPDPAQLAALVARTGRPPLDAGNPAAVAACIRDPKVAEAFLAELERDENVKKLKGFEKIKHLHLTLDAFTIDNGCLTPTMKLKRKESYMKFKEQIDGMYALADPASARL
ncbi:long-chain-fatty-acid-CoA ligase [Epithele typhae]|uniref:long-chain-fatty-acid-CoA ligase n=1 Tax=Epithele typhae TaxID=378194 RepID=UPI002008BA9D|nr:long-chain-fatty-acid-CoA ligase [Epithele typhae]KAH9925434.1 long-chain-fatty-acid-CoA ligase [Epithele typhae]